MNIGRLLVRIAGVLSFCFALARPSVSFAVLHPLPKRLIIRKSDDQPLLQLKYVFLGLHYLRTDTMGSPLPTSLSISSKVAIGPATLIRNQLLTAAFRFRNGAGRISTDDVTDITNGELRFPPVTVWSGSCTGRSVSPTAAPPCHEPDAPIRVPLT